MAASPSAQLRSRHRWHRRCPTASQQRWSMHELSVRRILASTRQTHDSAISTCRRRTEIRRDPRRRKLRPLVRPHIQRRRMCLGPCQAWTTSIAWFPFSRRSRRRCDSRRENRRACRRRRGSPPSPRPRRTNHGSAHDPMIRPHRASVRAGHIPSQALPPRRRMRLAPAESAHRVAKCASDSGRIRPPDRPSGAGRVLARRRARVSCTPRSRKALPRRPTAS